MAKKRSQPKRGRPPLPPGERRSERIAFVVTADEMATYDAAAGVAGVERSEWMRSVANAAAKKVLKK